MENSNTTNCNQRHMTAPTSRQKPIRRVIVGVTGVFVGVALIVAATMVFTLDLEDGFNLTETHPFGSSSHAIVAHDFAELADPPSWMIEEIRIQGTSATSADLFVGVAATRTVERFLNGVGHDEIVAIEFRADKTLGGVDYTTQPGTAVPTPPGLEPFWAATAHGPNIRSLDWPTEEGDWTAVIMNADGSAPVAADLALGMKIRGLTAIGAFALTFGIASLAGGTLLAMRGQRLRRQLDDGSGAALPALARKPAPTG